MKYLMLNFAISGEGGYFLGVGRFRILGESRFRILGGQGGQIPSGHMTSY